MKHEKYKFNNPVLALTKMQQEFQYEDSKISYFRIAIARFR
jgi:hypothetical protein